MTAALSPAGHVAEVQSIYAEPQHVESLSDCSFYHTMDIPGHGTIRADWDLRPGVRDYLGNVDLRGKRVLEFGPASGFLTFHMEQQGAEVVAFDINSSMTELLNVVPYARVERQEHYRKIRRLLTRLNNSFWFAHRVHGSEARVVYGNIYDVPEEIGPVDVATFGCVLLHLRDPFLALAGKLPLVRDTVIITEGFNPEEVPRMDYPRQAPAMLFQPEFHRTYPPVTWWHFSPEVLRRFLGVLGFEQTRVNFHRQLYRGNRDQLFTLVARRTAPVTRTTWYQP